jgi:hypothetical protein
MQRADLELWHGERSAPQNNGASGVATSYIHSAVGLFPSPLGRTAKSNHVAKVKSKFRFLGKFMAKAVMDSRMVSGLQYSIRVMSVHYYTQKIIFKFGIGMHCVAKNNGTVFVGCDECTFPVIYYLSCTLYP